jgi:L-rhamnose isomerase
MKITKASLEALPKKYAGFVSGDKLDEFFGEFAIKFAAGHWAAGGFADRFAPGGYFRPGELDESIEAQIARVAAAGIEGIEFHENVFTDERGRRDDAKLESVRKALKKHKLTPTNMNTNLWTDPKWKLGGLTNADKQVRKDALAVTLQGVGIARDLGCTSVALWPGSDGWDYNFEVNYGAQLDWFIEGCIEINKAAQKAGLRFGVEAKLHEPREGNMILPTTQTAMLVAREVNAACGAANMGVAIDYGHEQMYAVEPAFNLYLAKRMGVPVTNFHVNTAKAHSNDEDRVTGTGDLWRLVDFCYAAVDTGYDGWFGEDQFTYRMEPVVAMTLSRELFANAMKKALLIYARRDALKRAQATGDAGRTIEVVKDIIFTG